MFRVIYFTISIIAVSLLCYGDSVRAQNIEQEINEFLKANKKEEMIEKKEDKFAPDPFEKLDREKEVDVESLGLDNVDQHEEKNAIPVQDDDGFLSKEEYERLQAKKEAQKKAEKEAAIAAQQKQKALEEEKARLKAEAKKIAQEQQNKIKEETLPDLTKMDEEKEKPKQAIDQEKQGTIIKKESKIALPEDDNQQKINVLSRIQKMIKGIQERATKVENKQEETKPQVQEKAQIIDKMEKKPQLSESEIIQNEKLNRLDQLRKKYLVEIESKEFNQVNDNVSSQFSDDKIKIRPKRRNIDRFARYDYAPPPIMDKFRTKDNRHIPTILTGFDKITILFNAIMESDDISYFKSAYSQVGRPNIKNNKGDTILTYAILLQRHSITSSILSIGANPDQANDLGYTPLGIAIEIGDVSTLKALIDHNADIHYVDAFGRTYLMHAARTGFLPAVEMLISHGIDINAMDKDGFTALSIAYRHKKDVIVKYLLSRGAKTWVEKPYDSGSQFLMKELENRWKN